MKVVVKTFNESSYTLDDWWQFECQHDGDTEVDEIPYNYMTMSGPAQSSDKVTVCMDCGSIVDEY